MDDSEVIVYEDKRSSFERAKTGEARNSHLWLEMRLESYDASEFDWWSKSVLQHVTLLIKATQITDSDSAR